MTAAGKGSAGAPARPELLDISADQARRREMAGKATAGTELALDRQGGIVARERMLHDREAEADTAGLATPALVDPEEPLGQPRDMLLRDALAGVGDGEAAAAVVVRGPAQRDEAVSRRVPDGVRDEIAA